jgi:hypothetical protein
MTKIMGHKHIRAEAQQQFRQFAWNLAGTLASGKAAAKPPRPQPGKR